MVDFQWDMVKDTSFHVNVLPVRVMLCNTI